MTQYSVSATYSKIGLSVSCAHGVACEGDELVQRSGGGGGSDIGRAHSSTAKQAHAVTRAQRAIILAVCSGTTRVIVLQHM
jgi:hypothetical protein